MGGKEGSRGYLYQGIAAVLEALGQTGWDKIYVEFPTAGDKVDIALEENERITKAIQVKSTCNTFTKGDLTKWIKDIVSDFPCQHYELILIGQCAVNAHTFANSIEKLQKKQMDKKAISSLKGFDTTILNEAELTIKILPYDLEYLKAIARDSLCCYLDKSTYRITRQQIEFIVNAMLADQLLQATQESYTDRFTFDKALEDRITLIANEYSPQRIALGIKSFLRCTEDMPQETSAILDISDKFEDRNLKNGLSWHTDIEDPVYKFLRENLNQKQAYKLLLEAHSSIAFVAGRILDTKSGIDVFPYQKTRIQGQILWDVKIADKTEYTNWKVDYIQLSDEYFDSALILNVTHDIRGDVEQYIEDQGLHIGKLIDCRLSDSGETNFSIQNGTHALKLANTVYSALARRSTPERRAILHIFSSAPNGFMFFLGQVSRGFGKCILYEYDFEQNGSCSYSASIDF